MAFSGPALVEGRWSFSFLAFILFEKKRNENGLYLFPAFILFIYHIYILKNVNLFFVRRRRKSEICFARDAGDPVITSRKSTSKVGCLRKKSAFV